MNDAVNMKCNCQDPARVTPCPVHPVDPVEQEQYGSHQVEVIVKSTDRVNVNGLTSWSGFDFKCSHCGNASIMHWFNHCPECGSKLIWEFDKAPIINYMNTLNKK